MGTHSSPKRSLRPRITSLCRAFMIIGTTDMIWLGIFWISR